ncbi:MAG: branched-chain amino acid ABC transporter permease [Actinobacteria bacterium]|nr:branched-chain amino acid ABC transporter permease [Actinomycetota bacterium]
MAGPLAPPATAQETPDSPPATGEAALPQAFHGTLKHEGEPVQGVRITAARDGAVVGTVVTDGSGSWRIEVPSPGPYAITIDLDSLPAGVALRDPALESRTVAVGGGQERTILFPLGEGTARREPTFLDRLGQSIANGVKFGLIIAMSAVGLSLIFGTTGLINFAHGELVTMGAVVAWYFNRSGPRLHLLLAAALAIAFAGVAGGVLERGLWRPLRERRVGNFQLFVISIGLALLTRHVILLFFGAGREVYRNYAIQREVDLGLFDMTPRDLAVIALSLAILLGVATGLRVTRLGKAIRAVADNFDLAESSGIDVRRVILVVWVVGTMLAATGGIFFGVVENVEWRMGFRLLLMMFAGVILGGLGSAYGALVGGLVVGMATELSTLWFAPELKSLWALLVLIVVLLARPQGILGVRERVG